MAQNARTEETTAEMSRIFLGIQIQCAQCHDHPYDRWKREQFHELAAFFPRIGIRNVRDVTKRSFEVYSNDRFQGRLRKRNNNDRLPQAEHRMPDLDYPGFPGTVMRPRFFLTSAELSLGDRDAVRREQLAEWLTDNEWSALNIEAAVGTSSGYSPVNARRASRPRAQFADLFGFDPSQARESVAATIPQSLALMNAYEVNRHIRARKKNLLSGLVEKIHDNESLVVELYLRCLSREPSDGELARALAFCDKVPKRNEAFEDLLWALINSAEFRYRR